MRTAEEIAKEMRETGEWINKLNEELCGLAGLAEEYAEADGDTFEDVVLRAADILGVEIL